MNRPAGGGGGSSSTTATTLIQQGGFSTAGSRPWFEGADITKALTVLFVAAYIMTDMNDAHEALAFDFQKFLANGDTWRLMTCHFAFSSLGELIFGLVVLVPLSRRFEREMGQTKYGTFLFLTHLFGTILEFVITFLFLSEGFTRKSGPYIMIGDLIFLFYKYTPRLHPQFFGALGFDFSEKASTYFFAFQLLGSQGLEGILPTLCGFLSANLVMTEALPIHKWELPIFMNTIGSFFVSPFASKRKASAFTYVAGATNNRQQRRAQGGGGGGAAAARPLTPHEREQQDLLRAMAMSQAAHMQAQQQAAQQQHTGSNNNGDTIPTATTAPSPPPEEAIETLMAMGFDRNRVIAVLQQCDNNVEVAANRLLGG